MKKLECIIRPSHFETVKAALEQQHVTGMTATHVLGYGKQRGEREVYRGLEYIPKLLPKVKIEVVVTDDAVEDVKRAVVGAARTGQVGDGKIFIYDVVDGLRIRTGESQEEAID